MHKITRITCQVHSSLFQTLLTDLQTAGVYNLYHLSGRMAVLTNPRGLSYLLKSAGLASEPVDVISFLAPIERERDLLHLIARSCNLMIPGRGSVYSEHLQVLKSSPDMHFNQQLAPLEVEVQGLQIFSDLMAIACILQRQQSDDVVRMLLDIGVVPTVTHAVGAGLRDRLGLLRITLPREKDLVQVAVGPVEADLITEKIIATGQLDRPGKGFVWQTHLTRGVINFKTSQGKIGHAASVDQIIAAIDQMQGDFLWRQGLTGLEQSRSRNYMSGSELTFYLNAGLAEKLAQAVMQLGITGATVLSPKLLNPAQHHDSHLLPARESIRIMVPDPLIEAVLTLSDELGLCHTGKDTVILCEQVPRAFTYQKMEKKRQAF